MNQLFEPTIPTDAPASQSYTVQPLCNDPIPAVPEPGATILLVFAGFLIVFTSILLRK